MVVKEAKKYLIIILCVDKPTGIVMIAIVPMPIFNVKVNVISTKE